MNPTEDEGEIPTVEYSSLRIPTGNGSILEESIGVLDGDVTVSSHEEDTGPVELPLRTEEGIEASVTLSQLQADELHHYLKAHSTERGP